MKRKVMLLATAVAMVTLMVVGATLAFFTDEDTLTNTITVGDIKIDLTEEVKGEIPGTFSDAGAEYKLMPVATKDGRCSSSVEVYTKDAYVENLTDNAAYVRVVVEFTGLPDDFDGGRLLSVNDELWHKSVSESSKSKVVLYYYKTEKTGGPQTQQRHPQPPPQQNTYNYQLLKGNEKVNVFEDNIENLTKNEWTALRGSKNISWKVTAQAVQAENNPVTNIFELKSVFNNFNSQWVD